MADEPIVLKKLPDPYSVMFYVEMLPHERPDDRDAAVAYVFDRLDRYERDLGGAGIEVVSRTDKGRRVDVVVAPKSRDGDPAAEGSAAWRMAKLAVYLVELYKQMRSGLIGN
jgi:hypothetical protein